MLISLDDFKRALGITTEDENVFLYDTLKRVWGKAQNICDREFESSEKTEYYKGDGEQNLQVDRYPVTALGDVYIDNYREFNAEDKVNSAYLYISDRVNGIIIYHNNVFTSSAYENIKVTYTAGYTESTFPEELRTAILNLGIARYLKVKGAVNAVEGTDNRHTELEDEANDILEHYKRVR